MWSSDDEDDDESSEGGWSDDDSATVKSEYTDLSYGTLGSAVVVDARTSTSIDGSQRPHKATAAKPAALPLRSSSSAAASKQEQGEILFSPPDVQEGAKTGANEVAVTKAPAEVTEKTTSSKSKKKKDKKKKSKTAEAAAVATDSSSWNANANSDPHEIDFVAPLAENHAPPKKSQKGKIETVSDDDIVFDWANNNNDEAP